VINASVDKKLCQWTHLICYDQDLMVYSCTP